MASRQRIFPKKILAQKFVLIIKCKNLEITTNKIYSNKLIIKIGGKVKKALLILTYFCLSLFCINYKESESTIAVSYEQNDLYSQNVYILTLKNFNSNMIPTIFNNEEITVLSITPINYKSIQKEFIAKGTNIETIYKNFIKEYTDILTKKGLSEETIYIAQKGTQIEKIKILTIEKEIINLKKQIEFEYTIENSTY